MDGILLIDSFLYFDAIYCRHDTRWVSKYQTHLNEKGDTPNRIFISFAIRSIKLIVKFDTLRNTK